MALIQFEKFIGLLESLRAELTSIRASIEQQISGIRDEQNPCD
jgi:hypothetical protein